MLRPLACILAALLFAGCTAVPLGQPTGEGRALALEPLDDCFSRQGTELNRVVTTQGEWEQLWRQACGDGSVLRVHSDAASGGPPAVDFATRSVIAAFWGQKSSGGFEVHILEATLYPDRVVILVERSTPGPGCAVTAAISHPHALATVEKAAPAPQFQFRDTVRAC